MTQDVVYVGIGIFADDTLNPDLEPYYVVRKMGENEAWASDQTIEVHRFPIKFNRPTKEMMIPTQIRVLRSKIAEIDLKAAEAKQAIEQTINTLLAITHEQGELDV